MLLDPNDVVSRTILSTGRWEPAVVQAIRRHLAPGGTLVDVGAHIGYHSLKAAAAVGPAGHVIAIEPNPGTVRLLRDNIRASSATAIRVEPVACSNAEGTLELFAAAEANIGESSLARHTASGAGKIAGVYRVPARTLDAIVKEAAVSRVDVIKIDVEGAEMLVLQGARETLARYRPALILELIDSELQAMGTSSAAIREYLRAAGYSSGRNIDFFYDVEFVPEGR
jgi:FkbM family methyltransferase